MACPMGYQGLFRGLREVVYVMCELGARLSRRQRPSSAASAGRGSTATSRRPAARWVQRLPCTGGTPRSAEPSGRQRATEGQVISELTFGFWRFLLARRYTNIWPALAGAFPPAPNRSRRAVERPVEGLHHLRHRIAHHEPVWSQPLEERYSDAVAVLGHIAPEIAGWVAHTSRVPDLLAACPISRRPDFD
jgi:hypothetical protein